MWIQTDHNGALNTDHVSNIVLANDTLLFKGGDKQLGSIRFATPQQAETRYGELFAILNDEPEVKGTRQAKLL